MNKIFQVLFFSFLSSTAFATENHSGHDMNSHDSHSAMQNTTAGKANRVVTITMKDNMRFTPDKVDVKAGETILFRVKNAGKMQHEFVLGSMSELKQHAELMRQMPNMKHAEDNMITLKAGEQSDLTWTFEKTGTLDFACLVPGHLEAGMIGKVAIK